MRDLSMSRRIIAFRRYSWRNTDGGWAIYDGPSLFLIAEGSGYSFKIGRRLFKELTEQHKRGKK